MHTNPLKVSQWFHSFSDFKENIWGTFFTLSKVLSWHFLLQFKILISLLTEAYMVPLLQQV